MRATKPTEDRTVTFTLHEQYLPLLRAAAHRDRRTMAGLVRFLVLEHLEEQGLVDEDGNPVSEEDQPG